MTNADHLEQFTGDAASAEVLRRSLRAMADEFTDQPLGEKILAVLQGRADLRDVASDPDFAEFTANGMRAQEEAWAALTPEEREQQLRAGQEFLADLEQDLRNG